LGIIKNGEFIMAMCKLNQIIAVVTGKKSRAIKSLTESHRGWNKDAISGVTRIYQPKTDDGDSLPPENKNIQLDVPTKIQETMLQVGNFWDAVATQEIGNTSATASIKVNNEVILKDLPVTVILFLEKQLTDLYTFAKNLPTLPLDREWKFDAAKNCYVTNSVESIRTQKVPKAVVKYEATKEHPAQVEMFTEDKTVGTWSTVYMSSAIPSKKKAEILSRIESLQDAVKSARESANSLEVTQISLGDHLSQYVFGDLLQK